MSDTAAVVIKLTTEQKKRFVVLNKQIEKYFPIYQEAKALALEAMFEVWKYNLWVAQHTTLQDWLSDLENRAQNHLAIRQTFYDHMEAIAKLIATGVDLHTAARTVAKSPGVPKQLERLGVKFEKDGRGDEATYEVEVPDDFEEKTEGRTLTEYVGELATMSRASISQSIQHSSGQTTVSFSNLIPIPNAPPVTAGWFVVDVWTNGPDEWTSRQMYFAMQKDTPVEVVAAMLRRLNKTFEVKGT